MLPAVWCLLHSVAQNPPPPPPHKPIHTLTSENPELVPVWRMQRLGGHGRVLRIGHGKFSKVYKGRKKFTIRFVAVKSFEKSRREKVLIEVDILSKLNHPKPGLFRPPPPPRR